MTRAPDGGAREPSEMLARTASGLLLIGALTSLLLLGYALRRFAGSLAPGPVTWYVTLAAGTAGLAWCALRVKPAVRVTMAFSVLLLSGLLYGAEAALGLSVHRSQVSAQERLSARTGTPYDRRGIADVVRDLRTSGVPAVPSVVPAAILAQSGPNADPRTAWTSPLLPLGGLAGRPTVHLCNEDGQYRRYDSDEHGFANPPGTWTGLPPQIVLIGDSFTHGYCVSVGTSYADHLRRLWPATINLGTGGSGPLVELATLTEYAAPFRPRSVVWQYYENDMADLAGERRHSLLSRYLQPAYTQGLLSRQIEIDAALDPWVEQLWSSGKGQAMFSAFSWHQLFTLFHLRDLASSQLGRTQGGISPFAELPRYREILREARDRIRAWGGRLIFVFVPSWERYFQPVALAGTDVRDSVLEIVRGLDVSIVDIEPIVRAHANRERLYARQDLAPAHFSALGHELMAREVSRAIAKHEASAGSGR